MAASRYDERKVLIAEEANAIGSTYLRAQLLDQPTARDVRALVSQYLDARITLFDAGADPVQYAARERVALELSERIWARVAAVGRADPHSVMTGALVESTNQMIDLAAKRRAAIDNPVPQTVFVVLLLVSGIAMASIGFTCGLNGVRRPFGMLIMPLLVAAVIVLVFDIAYPRVGIVRIGDQTFLRLKQSM
jgi:hypothetical protein